MNDEIERNIDGTGGRPVSEDDLDMVIAGENANARRRDAAVESDFERWLIARDLDPDSAVAMVLEDPSTLEMIFNAGAAEEREACAKVMDASDPPQDQPKFYRQEVDNQTKLLARCWYVEGHDDATIKGAAAIRSRSSKGPVPP